MNVFVYSVLFIIFTPRLFFNFTKSRSTTVTLKETFAYAAVFTLAVIVVQYFSKRYGVLEGFVTAAENTAGTAAEAAAGTTAIGTDVKVVVNDSVPNKCNLQSTTPLSAICAPICAAQFKTLAKTPNKNATQQKTQLKPSTPNIKP